MKGIVLHAQTKKMKEKMVMHITNAKEEKKKL